MMVARKFLVSCLLVLSAALSCSQGAGDHSHFKDFDDWRMRHARSYVSKEEEARAREAWARNMDYIRAHNAQTSGFTLSMNQFGDKEMLSDSLTFSPEAKAGQQREVVRLSGQPQRLFQPPPPSSVDWSKRGVVGPVDNQGSMGSSDAIAVTEALESFHAILSGQLYRLSVQEVVDCCSQEPGLLVPDPYACIHKLGGLCSQRGYPPHPFASQPSAPSPACRSKMCTPVVNDSNRTIAIEAGDEQAMLFAVASKPLVVYVDASSSSFQFYKTGVYDDASCGKDLDHAMLLVGYGDNGDYWILKNSWGGNWGMNGYMQMKARVNMCGIADRAFYPA